MAGVAAGGSVAVVTPRRDVPSEVIKRLISRPEVHHFALRGFLGGQRVLYAWPDRKHLNDLRNAGADAIAVIEWAVEEPRSGPKM